MLKIRHSEITLKIEKLVRMALPVTERGVSNASANILGSFFLFRGL